jgi:hypothetical protein
MYKKFASGLLGVSALAFVVISAGAAAEEPPPSPGPKFMLEAPGEGAGPELPPLGHGPGADRLFMSVHSPGPGIGPGGPAQEVIHTLIELERLYTEQGRRKDVLALYQDVLARTKDPLVRRFAYDAIVRAQLQPADTDKAIATLKQSLDESLQRLNQPPPPPKGDKAP